MGAWLAALWVLFLAACGFFYMKIHNDEQKIANLTQLHHWISDPTIPNPSDPAHPWPGLYKAFMVDHVKLWSSGDPGAPPPPPPPMD